MKTSFPLKPGAKSVEDFISGTPTPNTVANDAAKPSLLKEAVLDIKPEPGAETESGSDLASMSRDELEALVIDMRSGKRPPRPKDYPCRTTLDLSEGMEAALIAKTKQGGKKTTKAGEIRQALRKYLGYKGM